MHCVDRGFCHVLIGVILFCCVFVLPLRTEKYLTSGTHCNWFWSFLVPGSSWFHYVFVLEFLLFKVLFLQARGFSMQLYWSLFCSSSCSLKHVVSLCICIGVCFVHPLVLWSTWFHCICIGIYFAHGLVLWSTWFHYAYALFILLTCSLKHVISLCICNGVCFIYSLICMFEVVVFPPDLEYTLKE